MGVRMKGKLLVVEYWHSGRESDRMVRLEDYLKLSEENAKLRECVERYARVRNFNISMDAIELLKELEEE
jgi:hypothetical protein